MKTRIALSLISHTNVGKTTLARTLLRRDVGEILDQAHVTDESEVHRLIETDDAVLELWDTPGFGDSVRLLRRLRRERQPLGWFLHQVWDRIADRPMWCSQRAVRNVKEEADVVLYLVNASESPHEAGYVEPELEILSWIGKPVLLLLNQTTGSDATTESQWREYAGRWTVIRDVLTLDAFTRCWVEESVMLRRVENLLDGPARIAIGSLIAAWDGRNRAVFDEAMRHLGEYLARAATDREARGAGEASGVRKAVRDALRITGRDRKVAMKALDRRLDESTRNVMKLLIAEHGLSGESSAGIEKRLHDFQLRGQAPIDEKSGALAGAVVSGALGGLAADALSGGLTLGGGMIAGGILGALGGSALAWGYRLLANDGEPAVAWSPGFLDQLTRQAVLRYLAVAHFGRGRGPYRDIEHPEHWSNAVDAALAAYRSQLSSTWKAAAPSRPPLARIRGDLTAIAGNVTRNVLRDAYPHAFPTD